VGSGRLIGRSPEGVKGGGRSPDARLELETIAKADRIVPLMTSESAHPEGRLPWTLLLGPGPSLAECLPLLRALATAADATAPAGIEQLESWQALFCEFPEVGRIFLDADTIELREVGLLDAFLAAHPGWELWLVGSDPGAGGPRELLRTNEVTWLPAPLAVESLHALVEAPEHSEDFADFDPAVLDLAGVDLSRGEAPTGDEYDDMDDDGLDEEALDDDDVDYAALVDELLEEDELDEEDDDDLDDDEVDDDLDELDEEDDDEEDDDLGDDDEDLLSRVERILRGEEELPPGESLVAPAREPAAPAAQRTTAVPAPRPAAVPAPATDGPPAPPAPYFRQQVADLADIVQCLDHGINRAADEAAGQGEASAALALRLEELRAECLRLRQFTRTLAYTVAPPGRGDQRFDLGPMLEEMLTALRSEPGAPRYLIRTDGDLGLRSDRSLLGQVFDALFFLAHRAAGEGGSVRVDARGEDGRVEVSIRFPGGPYGELPPGEILQPYGLRRLLPELGANALAAASGLLAGQEGSLELRQEHGGGLEWVVSLPGADA